MQATEWFLTPTERGNPATVVDTRHGDGAAYTLGNDVAALVHGRVYFQALYEVIEGLRGGDLLLFTDWRGDPDQLLAGPGTEVGEVLAAAARRGVVVRGLVWRSHWDRFRFSGTENRQLDADIDAAGGLCLRDMRVRVGGSHHQKLVVARHRERPQLDVAFVGGIDIGHSRGDDDQHDGDPQAQPMAAVYGPTPPWHDVQAAIRGPAVGDVEATFRERWDDPAAISRHPVGVLADWARRDRRRADRLPDQLPDPPPCGTHAVQILRTYPYRRPSYPFAPAGERSIALAYRKALTNAQQLIYVEDQYLWSAQIAEQFAEALRRAPQLRLVAVVPRYPDQDGALSLAPSAAGQGQALEVLLQAGGERVTVYNLENAAGTPIYVHAKVCIIDDTWVNIGSDNFNQRSWTHDSELACAIIDTAAGSGSGGFARTLRLQLAAEHLESDTSGTAQLIDPAPFSAAFARAAAELDRWYDTGQTGARPPGRLRRHDPPRLAPATRLWAGQVYRTFFDPDGRPTSLRRAGRH